MSWPLWVYCCCCYCRCQLVVFCLNSVNVFFFNILIVILINCGRARERGRCSCSHGLTACWRGERPSLCPCSLQTTMLTSPQQVGLVHGVLVCLFVCSLQSADNKADISPTGWIGSWCPCCCLFLH